MAQHCPVAARPPEPADDAAEVVVQLVSAWWTRSVLACLQLIATVASLLALHGDAQAQDDVIPPGKEQAIQALLGPLYGSQLKGDHRFSGISIDRTSIRFVLSRGGKSVGSIVASPRHPADPDASASFSFKIDGDAQARPYLDGAVAQIRARDTGTIYQRTKRDAPLPPHPTLGEQNDKRPPIQHWVWLLLLAPLLLPKRRDASSGRPRFRLTHLLPVVLQLTIFSYWALYWLELREFAIDIALQLLFGLVFDLLLSWRRYGELRPSFGLIPIVLSANLIVIFGVGEWFPHFAIIAIALLSKELIHRNGRHIFNPSGLAVTIVGIFELTVTGFPSGDIAHQFGALPNMTEVVLIVALVVQLKVRVVLLTFGATISLMLYSYVGNGFGPFWAPVTLVIALFATDPATTPRSSTGKLLFGLTLGLLMGVVGDSLAALGQPDFYGKVAAVPLANLLTPWLDRVGQQLEARRPFEMLSVRYNRWHVFGWILFVALMYQPDIKAGAFTHTHAGPDEIQHLHLGKDGALTCELNPPFCRPFSFVDELALWTRDRAP